MVGIVGIERRSCVRLVLMKGNYGVGGGDCEDVIFGIGWCGLDLWIWYYIVIFFRG